MVSILCDENKTEKDYFSHLEPDFCGIFLIYLKCEKTKTRGKIFFLFFFVVWIFFSYKHEDKINSKNTCCLVSNQTRETRDQLSISYCLWMRGERYPPMSKSKPYKSRQRFPLTSHQPNPWTPGQLKFQPWRSFLPLSLHSLLPFTYKPMTTMEHFWLPLVLSLLSFTEASHKQTPCNDLF